MYGHLRFPSISGTTAISELEQNIWSLSLKAKAGYLLNFGNEWMLTGQIQTIERDASGG
jgi:hypothetical protein